VPKPELSIIVPTYNEKENIGNILKALNKQTATRRDYEIIIVDGGSKDGTRDLAKKYGADKVIVQKGEGIAGAKNDGADAAKGKILATMDADVIPTGTWVQTLLKRFANERIIGLAGVSASIEQDSISRLSLRALALWARICAAIGRPLLSGQGSAIRLDVFKKIGGFNPEFNMIHDVEIGMRAKKYGKIAFDKDWIVYTSSRRIKKMGLRKYFSLMGKAAVSYITTKRVSGAKYVKEDYGKKT
jgi:glycosyltransferase involved in cell wall biosynthesis